MAGSSMVKRLFLGLLLLWTVNGFCGTVTLSSGWNATVADFNCQTVISAFLTTLNATSGDCQYQYVAVGTVLTFRNSSGVAVSNPTVSSVTGWTAPSGGTGSSSSTDWSVQSMLVVLAVFFSFFTGFNTGFRP